MKLIKITLLIICVNTSLIKAAEIVSPNAKIKVVLETAEKSGPQFKVTYTGMDGVEEVLPLSPLGLKTNKEDFSRLTLISESQSTFVHDSYTMISGKRKDCSNLGNEKTFRFKNPSGKCIDIIFRAYNDGVAFRYALCDFDNSKNSITEELTAYTIPNGTSRWIQRFNTSYEDFYPLSTAAESKRRWAYPALFNPGKDVFMLITEADISRANYASSLISDTNEKTTAYKVALPENDSNGNGFTLPWKSPWRVLIIGKLNDIIESTLVTDVSTPCKLAETDWIKPGSASWIYWAHNHGTKDYKILVEYVDLAEAMGWPYTLIDWEWDQMGNGGNIKDIVKYANDKGIKPLMWYNSGTAWMGPTPNDRMNTAERRVKEFEWLNEIGVYGVKVDFFAGDQQDTMNYYISILEDAAKYKLMVNFHGCTAPRGWRRTYPNLMSMEGVYGAEQYNNGRQMTPRGAEHNTILPFTRNAIGPMDYTPVAFTNSQHAHTTSYAHELALAVVFECGFQHFADRPSGFANLPESAKNLLKKVPTAWDRTKLLDGYPGKLTVIARQKGDCWYIGGINGENNEKTVKLDFGFLPTGSKYNLTLIKDGNDVKSFDTTKSVVNLADDLELKLLGKGGFAAILEEIK